MECPNCKETIRFLSKTEKLVVKCVLDNKTNKEIADVLFVSEKAIKFHLTNIFKKEMVSSRYELQERYSGIV